MIQMQQGLAAWRATGAAVFRPYGLALLATASAKMGQHEAGLTLLADFLPNNVRRVFITPWV